ncbi:MAG: 2-oxoacid:acceptor oxidoreductase family protein [Candidatus Omnitrophica bacterium]|nr:2-oxoacid:acceptor oxidoreductase family protein [Candidatus Omnitrophota bacterium]
MKEELICAGFGGQGIMVLGKFLAQAIMKEGKFFVTWMPSYGAEVRGGTAHSMVVISDKEIASPLVTHPTTAIVMNQPSLDKFLPKTKDLIISNSTLAVCREIPGNLEILEIPATEMATDLGDVRVANTIVLGAYLKKKKVALLSTIAEVFRELFSGEVLKLNERALNLGFSFR